MPHRYGSRSSTRLKTCHPDLQFVMDRVVEQFPNTILQGERTEEQQRKNVAKGVSRTLDSKHLPRCSRRSDQGVDAVDAAPDPLQYPQLSGLLHVIERALGAQPLDDTTRRNLVSAIGEYSKDLGVWYYFGGYVLGTADQMLKNGDISTRFIWGGDWNENRKVNDQTFDDLGHFQRAV